MMTIQDHMQDSQTTDPLVATVAASHVIRTVLTGLLCLVLGVWGIYDYVWKIPRAQEDHLRGETCRDVRSALDGIAAKSPPTNLPAIIDLINLQLKSAAETDAYADSADWVSSLETFKKAIDPPSTISRTDLPEIRVAAMERVEAGLALYGDTNPPAKYDRVTQWVFILCLPFVPYFVLSLRRSVGKTYRLDPDGTLTLPGGAVPADQIAEIDMHRWMKKSVCWLVLVDGKRIKLDAHIFKDLDAIIGVIANRIDPDHWDLDARPVTDQSSSEPEGDTNAHEP